MHGAMELDPGFFEADIMINLDSEDIDEIYIACAGAAATTASLPLKYRKISSDDYKFSQLSLTGLEGGHSGVDIILNRANAIKVLGRVLSELGENIDFSIVDCSGGSLWNAIPREASAKIAVAKSADIECELRKIEEKIQSEFRESDPDLQLNIVEAPHADTVIDNSCTSTIINVLNIFPNGFFKMSDEIPGVVETSSNLGIMKIEDGRFIMHSMQRSLIDRERDLAQERITVLMKDAGFDVTFGTSFPGWVPKPHSPVVGKCEEVYKNLFGKSPKIMAIHAGLECGIIGKKHPEMDMIAIGPTMKFPHSPKEKVNIESVEKFWKLMLAMIQ